MILFFLYSVLRERNMACSVDSLVLRGLLTFLRLKFAWEKEYILPLNARVSTGFSVCKDRGDLLPKLSVTGLI